MKKILVAILLLIAVPAYADWFEKTDFYFFGINTKMVKEADWKMVALGAVTAVAVHTAAHYAYAGANGMSVDQDGLLEVVDGDCSNKKIREFSQIGLFAQNIGGLILTSIPATRQSDFTKGYVAAAFVETAFYPAFWSGTSGDLHISNKYGGNKDIEYAVNLVIATHNVLRVKWRKD